MAGKTVSVLSVFIIVVLLASSVPAVPDGQALEEPFTGMSRDGPRAVLLNRMSGSPPTIDGIFGGPEWSEATSTNVGINGNDVRVLMMADGEVLYVLVDILDDTDLDVEPAAPNCIEFTAMVFDGDGDGRISYNNGEQGSAGVADGGLNADFGIISWGDDTIWNSDVVMSGNSILFDTVASTNAVIATGFTGSPNKAQAHRILEYSIPYDGPQDHLGSSLGYTFTKGWNIQSLENNSNTQVILGQNPNPLGSLANSFDTVNLPIMYPHILDIMSPAEGAVYQEGQDIKFEIDALDNNDTTLQRTLYLNGAPVSMGTSDVLIRNDLAIGQYDVSFRIQDDEGYNDTADLGIIRVAEAASPPVIDSASPSGDTVNINEGEEVKITIDWHDDNLDQANESVKVTWNIDGQPANQAWINKTSKNATHHTSELTFKSSYTGDFDAGTYVVNFEIEDKYFDTYDSAVDSWTITVSNVNRRPSIDNTEPPAGQSYEMSEEDTKTFTIIKSDPDNDVLTVRWYVNDVQQTGFDNNDTFHFNEDAPDYTSSGAYTIKVVVADKDFTDERTWDITVTNVNLAPIIDEMQLVPDDQEIDIDEGENLAFSYKATDPDGDGLSYTWYVNDLTKDLGTGVGTFTFETAYLKAEGYDSTGSPYFVKLIVSDGFLNDEYEWKVNVDNTNRAPVPIIDRPKEGDIFKVEERVNFKTSSSYDSDGEKLSYSWDFGDRKTATGTEVNHEFSESGRYTITLKVSDGHVEVVTKVYITIAIAVLRLDDLDFEPKGAKDGDVVTLKAKISNIGDAGATNVQVNFYVGSRNPSGLIASKVLQAIPSGEQYEANTSWVAKGGNQLLIVVVEPSDDYQIQGKDDKQVAIQVAKKVPPPPPNPLEALLLPILLIVIIVVIIAVIGGMAYSRKKKREADEDAAVKAILDSKHEPPPKHKVAAETSPYDRTDFQFGPVEGDERPCEECGTITTNPSGLCDTCTFDRRKREESDRMMDCPVCGNEVSKDMFTCPYCHFNFSKMDKEEEVKDEHEPVGYVSDDACADCGVLFNDGMKMVKCPSCEATYHKRCASRLATCAECHADLSAGQSKTFRSAVGLLEEKEEEKRKEEEEKAEEGPEPEPEPTPEPVPTKAEEEAKCPGCGEEVEKDWKVCPNCDRKLGVAEPAPPKVEPKKVPPPPTEGKCPKCNEEVEPDWKVCPNCDHRLDGAVAEKKAPEPLPKEPPKVRPKKEAPPPKEGKCPSCGEPVETDWKVCPNCDKRLGPPPPDKKETRPVPKDKVKRKITWSKKAKEQAKVTEPEERPVKKEPPKKEEVKKDEGEGLETVLDGLMKDIEAAEKDGKVVKKAKSLATLAGSFLKGKKPDKAKIYIERAQKELEK